MAELKVTKNVAYVGPAPFEYSNDRFQRDLAKTDYG
ncbi:hypothetical protein JOC54_003178 [Alkalihalobacillus xiaoxiensis]|uniref:Uncharacterized protein n=1 Tax=Shouchella xiaoxiensis TaxID=766895 RepID=A0ABS2SWI2_9BACI|nr:hypothetical protein [Shouchella xiaoxiensis]